MTWRQYTGSVWDLNHASFQFEAAKNAEAQGVEFSRTHELRLGVLRGSR
jgi:hypothetical protein